MYGIPATQYLKNNNIHVIKDRHVVLLVTVLYVITAIRTKEHSINSHRRINMCAVLIEIVCEISEQLQYDPM